MPLPMDGWLKGALVVLTLSLPAALVTGPHSSPVNTAPPSASGCWAGLCVGRAIVRPLTPIYLCEVGTVKMT